MKAVFVFVGAVIVASVVLFVVIARGPEGSAWAKEVEDHVSAAATQCGLKLTGVTSVPPDRARLATLVCLKHHAKGLGRAIGIIYPEADSAQDYVLVQPDSEATLHCLTRISGDHLIGIDLQIASSERAVADRLREALQKEFHGHRFSLVVTERT